MPASMDDAAVLTALLEAAVDAIIVSDCDGIIVRANRSACKMFGHEMADLLGQNLKILMPKIWADQHDGFIKRFLDTGEKRIIGIGRDVTGMRKDGTEFPLHLSVGESTQNGTTLFVGLLHDLTRRRASQKALERSQRMDAIGRLTGGVSHDFNNLLTVIIGNLELLQPKLADAAETDLLNDALEAAELGSNLTSHLLAFSRKGELSPEPVSPNDAVNEAMALLRRTISPRIEMRADLAPDLPAISVDQGRLQSALMNLAINSRDAMPDGGSLHIQTSHITIDDSYIAQEIDLEFGDYICLSVSDTGQGMSPETQKHALEPFFTTKPSGEGTGLGLATLYGFVRQSGGYVALYSEPDVGTSVSMYFPIAEDSAPRRGKAKRQGPDQRDQGKGKTALVVEDDTSVRRLTKNRLEALGYSVETATSADSALEVLESGTKADLLLTDLIMPGTLTGRDLARIAKEKWPDMHIILTSGYSEEMAQKQAPDQGGFDLLRKPYRQADLSLRLRQIFSNRKT